MKDKKKTIINLIIFIILILITYYIIFRNQNIYELYNQIKDLNILYLLIGIITMFLYYLIEAYNIKSILKSFNSNISLFKSFKYTLIGFFFSSITPGATGGQPMEIYYLSKEKIPVSHSTLALLLQLCGFHISGVMLGIIGIIVNPNILDSSLIYFFIAGTLLNTIPISITIIGIFFPKLFLKLIKIITRLISHFKNKTANKIIQKINKELEIYQESSNFIKNSKKTVYEAIFLAFLQALVYYIVPYFIYKSFGLTGKTIIDFILIQSILHSTVCSMPLPGSVGVSETIYLLIYGLAYPSNLLQSSLLVNRFISFYLFVIISLIVYIINKINSDNKKVIK